MNFGILLVSERQNNMSEVYKALADPTRRRIIQLLRQREMSAGELAEYFDLAKPTLSGHFAVLRAARLVQSEKHGATVIYRLNLSVLEEALVALMDGFGLGVGDYSAPTPDTKEKTS
jgi:ArsR family transcriptional regulator